LIVPDDDLVLLYVLEVIHFVHHPLMKHHFYVVFFLYNHPKNHWIFFEKIYHYVELLDVMETVNGLKMNLLMMNEI